jgi:hypothetical protein
MPSGSSIHISVKPQGSAAGSRMTGTPAAASRACSARTFRTWIQIITECPVGPSLCPEHHAGILRGAELPVDGQAKYIAVEAAAAVRVAGPQQDPAAQNVHATISASR